MRFIWVLTVFIATAGCDFDVVKVKKDVPGMSLHFKNHRDTKVKIQQPVQKHENGKIFRIKNDEKQSIIKIDDQVKDYQVYAQYGETLKLYSKWSGVSLETILKKNGFKRIKRLKINEVIVIPMTGKQAKRFISERELFVQKYKRKFYKNYKLEKVVEYTIKKGDTIGKIIKKFEGYKIPLWTILEYNSGLNIYLLYVGKKINIPLFKKKENSMVLKRENFKMCPIIVQKGESLKLLAKFSGAPVSEIKKYNKLEGDRIYAGQELLVPVVPEKLGDFYKKRINFSKKFNKKLTKYWTFYRIKRGDNAWKIAKKFDVPLSRLKDYNRDVDLSVLSPGQWVRIPKTKTPFDELPIWK